MTPDRLAELKRLCEAATPGPWEANMDQVWCDGWLADVHRDENAAFIAAARTALPGLIAEVERLTDELAERDSHYPGDFR